MPALLSLFEYIRLSPTFDGAARLQDESKIEDGILKRALEPMISVLQQVSVRDDELEERTAEMFHTTVFVASSAAIHPPYHAKYDFFLMSVDLSTHTHTLVEFQYLTNWHRHHVNSSIMYLTTLQQPWLSRKDKCRLLEWKIRMDLIQYLARGRPTLSLDAIASYKPKILSNSSVRGQSMDLQHENTVLYS
jgi:hypothetical protein